MTVNNDSAYFCIDLDSKEKSLITNKMPACIGA